MSSDDEDPHRMWARWFAEATASESDANAMCLATVDSDGMPNARMVLLKSADADSGFVFFSHLSSPKGREIEHTPHVALVFYWRGLHRQVRIRGTVSTFCGDEVDDYWATRAREAQLSALASNQSQPLASRDDLLQRVALLAAQVPADVPIPRPPNWCGFRVTPTRFEFFTSAGVSRLHERVEFLLRADRSGWQRRLLQP
jgi:pyridoxamine 5'-phosphate oxidase